MKYTLAIVLLVTGLKSEAQQSSVWIDSSVISRTGKKVSKEPIPFTAEVMPVPSYDFDAYLVDHMQFPKGAMDFGVPGKVTVRFIVHEDGSIGKVFISHSSSNNVFDAEVVRVVRGMPPWKPGMQNGKPVKVSMVKSLIIDLE